MKIKFLIFFFLIIHTFAFAQSSAEAERLFNLKQYTKAKTLYEALLKSKPTDPLFSYRLARCNFELKDWDNAIKNFEISGTKFPLTQWYLAEALFNSYRFEASIVAFDNFITTLTPDDKRIHEIELQKQRAENANRLLWRVEDIAIIDSVITDKTGFLKKIDMGFELGSLRQSAIKIHASIVDKITYTTQRGDRQIYSDTICGNTDIYSTYRLLDKWSDPVSISDVVNSPANENYPFLLPDGLTLYFGSDGENSVGGYDIFVTRYSSVSQGFLTPENVGFPFNSPANDYMMVIDELHSTGWFATDRNQQTGKVAVYKFRLNDEKTIYRTQNQDTLRLAASLKLYRKAIGTQNTELSRTETLINNAVESFSLIISDNLIYTKTDDFQNPAALSLWNEYQKLKISYNQLNILTQELRIKYENANDEKRELVDKILLNEKELNNLRVKMDEAIRNVRNEEILFIGKKTQN